MKTITVTEYAKLKGKSKAQIYLDIRTGKIPASKIIKPNQIMIKL